MIADGTVSATQLDDVEQQLVFLLSQYPQRVGEAGTAFAPSYIAQYAYELAKTFNQFYDKLSILKETDAVKLHARLDFIESQLVKLFARQWVYWA